jgi:hypothetical protein
MNRRRSGEAKHGLRMNCARKSCRAEPWRRRAGGARARWPTSQCGWGCAARPVVPTGGGRSRPDRTLTTRPGTRAGLCGIPDGNIRGSSGLLPGSAAGRAVGGGGAPLAGNLAGWSETAAKGGPPPLRAEEPGPRKPRAQPEGSRSACEPPRSWSPPRCGALRSPRPALAAPGVWARRRRARERPRRPRAQRPRRNPATRELPRANRESCAAPGRARSSSAGGRARRAQAAGMGRRCRGP